MAPAAPCEMNQTDPRAQAAFDAALHHIKATTATAAERVSDHLGVLASAATRVPEREALVTAQIDLRRHMATFVVVFGDTLAKRVSRELNPNRETGRSLAETDWQSLSLVDDDEVEDQMHADRIAQAIGHGCEWELRELASYTGQMLGLGRAEHERNPLRGEVLGEAVLRAISAVSNDRTTRKVLARELGLGLSRVMAQCYADILKDLRARGIQPVGLTVRGVEGPGNEMSRDHVVSGYDRLQRDTGTPTAPGHFGETTPSGLHDRGTGPASRPDSAFGRSTRPGVGPGSSRSGTNIGGGSGTAADVEMMTLLRRLTVLATRPADLGTPSGSAPYTSAPGGLGSLGAPRTGDAAGFAPSTGHATGFDAVAPGLVAANLIRAHRDELRQATTGALDHMVIDVVGSLFDQILSDPRVPPQMARQIARLQLPVLRVALVDNTFFSSRKHPVRRFVNRLASLAAAFEDLDDGTGKQFMARVRELVQEIVQGDFDQIELYSSKLSALENFVAQQARAEVEANTHAVSVVDGKESDLRVQQRYMLQLRTALTPISLPDYLRDFLAQVWSQAIAMATKHEGPQSDAVQRLKRAGRDLVMSVQPKGSPAMRKRFLMQLPPLMKDLNEGMKLVGWPEAAQKDFFGKLLPAHAESLKGQSLSELDYNLLAKQLEGIFNTPLPAADGMLRDVAMTSTGAEAITPHFSDTEAQQIGLVDEAAVDWSKEVDIDLSLAEADPEPVNSAPDTTPLDLNLDLAAQIDINLDQASDPAEPTHGPQLIDHVKLGFAYRMHLSDQWQKVRLSYVSPGRAFFVFTRGKRHTETVSLTARMLARMCETGRFKAFESAYLIERATVRARKQLAALTANSR